VGPGHVRLSAPELAGHVDVSVGRTDDPSALGAFAGARDLAWCEAVVETPLQGYRAMVGWVQLVRSEDNRSGGAAFELDPLEVLGDVGHPFMAYGVRPVLFDAPSRRSRAPLDWLAHSYLAVIDDAPSRTIRPLLGFSWGFVIGPAGAVTITPPEALHGAHWDADVAALARACPAWRYAPGWP
jgi:hypothetical protein